MIDPGHDLNKNTRHSLELTRRLDEIAALGFPLLAAVSNKDFIGEATGLQAGPRLRLDRRRDRRAPCRAPGSCACTTSTSAVRAATMVEAILGFREPAQLSGTMRDGAARAARRAVVTNRRRGGAAGRAGW